MMAFCSGMGRSWQLNFVVKPCALVNIKSTARPADLDLDLCLRMDCRTGAAETRRAKGGLDCATEAVADTRADDDDDAGTTTGASVPVKLPLELADVTRSRRSRRLCLGLHNNSARKMDVEEFELSSSCSPRLGLGLGFPNSRCRKSEVSESPSSSSPPAPINPGSGYGRQCTRTNKACNASLLTTMAFATDGTCGTSGMPTDPGA